VSLGQRETTGAGVSWTRAARVWLRYMLLPVSALLLWLGSSLLLDAFPVRLELSGNDKLLSVTVDGSPRAFDLAAPLRSVRFVPPQPYAREYQIDGSDTTNTLTLDHAYFAQIAETPYYRFQALLRDEGSYSQWKNLVVRNQVGVAVVADSAPALGVESVLPQPFLLTVDLRRMEAPRTLELEDESGATLRMTINRNDRYVQLVEETPGDFPLERARWFFPNDWLPMAAVLAHTALRLLAIALALASILVPVALLVPGTISWKPGRRALAWIPVLFAAVALVAGCYTGIALFDRAPHILDGVSYYFQGKILASGALSAPAPPVDEAFATPFTVVHDGKWFSQYPPGAPLVLAIGFLMGAPWLIEPLLAAGTVLLVFGVARRQYGSNTALLAALLMASSPFLHLMSGSFLSHVPTVFFVACFLYGTMRYLESPSGLWAVAAGLSLGVAFLTREIVALLYGLPVGLCLLKSGGRSGIRLRDLAFGAAAFGLMLVVYLLYNWALTGYPWLLPRLLHYGGDRLGFGDGVGFYGQHTPAAGLVNTDELLTSLSFTLFGWPMYASLALMAMPFLMRRSVLWDRVHGGVVALLILTYFAYFYHGIALGPRYYFDAFPSMVLLTARGFAVLTALLASLVQAMIGRRDWHGRGRLVSLALCAALLACNLLYFSPRQLELYRGFTGLPGGSGPVLGDFVQSDVSGRSPALKGALVTTTDWWVYAVYLSAMNSPRLDGDAVFALIPSGEAGARLKGAFSGRDWYRVVRDNRNNLVAEWSGRVE